MFPDVERALVELTTAALGEEVLVGTHLPYDYTTNLPAIQIRALPSTGQDEPWERIIRVQVDVYGSGRTEARALSMDLRDALVGRGRSTTEGLLDDISVESEPHESPFVADVLTLFSTIYRVETRAS